MSIKTLSGNIIQTLTVEEVGKLHDVLSTHEKIIEITEPISPKGIKDFGLLESAVSRQYVGSGVYYKYDSVYRNCATLVYGLIKNHSFHNGNKRVALLAMILHLYKNGYVVKLSMGNDDIYSFLKAIASNSLKKFAQRYHRKLHKGILKNDSLENQIEFVSMWIRKNSVSKPDAERPIKWKYLIKKLSEFGIQSRIDQKCAEITLIKYEKGFLGFGKREFLKLTYPYENRICRKRLIK